MILFINSCVRPESRTMFLARILLEKIGDEVKEVFLPGIEFPKADNAFITKRNDLIENCDYRDPLFDFAKDFAAADTIVIAAPYWDLSFPSMLKQYLEQICVLGITFCYENDMPKSLCKAKKLYYVTTAGGPIYSDAFGYGYVETLCRTFFGIEESRQIKAEGLDLIGADVEKILGKVEINI